MFVMINEVITIEASSPRLPVSSHKCSIIELVDDENKIALIPYVGHEVADMSAISILPESYNDSLVSIFV